MYNLAAACIYPPQIHPLIYPQIHPLVYPQIHPLVYPQYPLVYPQYQQFAGVAPTGMEAQQVAGGALPQIAQLYPQIHPLIYPQIHPQIVVYPQIHPQIVIYPQIYPLVYPQYQQQFAGAAPTGLEAQQAAGGAQAQIAQLYPVYQIHPLIYPQIHPLIYPQIHPLIYPLVYPQYVQQAQTTEEQSAAAKPGEKEPAQKPKESKETKESK